MPDVFTKAKRSEVMSRIRSSGTAIEDRLYDAVREVLGWRWRIDRNVKGLPGSPDLVIPSLRLAVFADGCFYHGCSRHGRIPESNRAYWEPKLRANALRDTRNRRKLRSMGYSVWRFWEHDLEGRRVLTTKRTVARRLTPLQLEVSSSSETLARVAETRARWG